MSGISTSNKAFGSKNWPNDAKHHLERSASPQLDAGGDHVHSGVGVDDPAFLLTQATQRWDVYEENYGLLFGLNTILAVFLLLVISWIGWRLVLRLRQKNLAAAC